MKSKNTNAGILTLESQPEAILHVETFIEGMSHKHKFKEDVYGNIMIAITEAVNNAIFHGNKCDAEKKIEVEFVMEKPYIFLVKVRDEGEGFDPESLPDPTAPENVGKPGGRGVFLMRELSDDLTFNDNGRESIMRFYI